VQANGAVAILGQPCWLVPGMWGANRTKRSSVVSRQNRTTQLARRRFGNSRNCRTHLLTTSRTSGRFGPLLMPSWIWDTSLGQSTLKGSRQLHRRCLGRRLNLQRRMRSTGPQNREVPTHIAVGCATGWWIPCSIWQCFMSRRSL